MSRNWGIGRSYKVKLKTLHFAIRTKIDEIFINWFNSISKMEMCDLKLKYVSTHKRVRFISLSITNRFVFFH